MIYKPFFDMNILLTDDAIGLVANIAGFLILFHVLLAIYLIYRLVVSFNKTSLRLIAEDIK